ncbi:hypothetical protein JZ751_020697 [Albula glossodonta]|uniref:Uncharacterized protein n=1 Tax=Albula glossodonta TaxID=121402 RepID=A0A8T2PIF7_9TELE|nr:hypothetical protein JZ751_020697 [Albula glossodonta]
MRMKEQCVCAAPAAGAGGGLGIGEMRDPSPCRFSLFLENSQLECSEQEQDVLGQGGSGTIIYRAKYRELPVAIKRFHFKKCRQQSLDRSTGTAHPWPFYHQTAVVMHTNKQHNQVTASPAAQLSVEEMLTERGVSGSPSPSPSASLLLVTVTLK